MAAAVSPQQATPPIPPPEPDPSAAAAATASSGPATDEVKSTTEVKEDSAKTEKWTFIEPQPIREEQVKNAVNFLSHPRVRGSPIVHRRSFLERKGLTREEIDEAFRRVPDPPSSDSTRNVVSTEGKLMATPPVQTETGTSGAAVSSQPQPKVQPSIGGPPQTPIQVRTRPHWSHLIVGAGVLAAAGAGTGYFFQRMLVPKLKAWLRDIVLEGNTENRISKSHLVEEDKPTTLTPVEEAVAAAAAAANAAAVAATEVANTSKELLKSRTEEWQQLRSALKSLEIQTDDIKSTFNIMDRESQRLQGQKVSIPYVHADEPITTNYYKGSLQRTALPTEQVYMMPPVVGNHNKPQGVGMSKGQISNGHSSVHDGYVSNTDEWWRQKKVEKETVNAANHEVRLSDLDTISDQDIGSPTRYAANTSGELWWQRKARGESFTASSRDPGNTVQATEIDNVSAFRRVGASNQNQAASVIRQGWVPPPVPSTVMPGALSAIRYQKPATVADSKPLVPQEKEIDSQTGHSTDLSEVAEISSVDKEIPFSSTKELIEEPATAIDTNV